MIENFIRWYDNVVDDQFCDELVEKFEQHQDQTFKVAHGDRFNFQELRLLDHLDTFEHESNVLKDIFLGSVKRYKIDCNIQDVMFPTNVGYENFRMKKYEPNGKDQFNDHVDVGDYTSARRFLVFFLYLNDNEAGQTDFPQMDISVQPKKGRLLVFPPLWTHLHAGRPPVNTPKYIVGSYLHYVDEQ